MSGLGKELLFGDALGGEDIGNLDLANVFEVDDLLGEGEVKKQPKKRTLAPPRKDSISIEENPLLPVNESDLHLEVICVQEGEKIYRLSDLLIPVDQKKIRKIESYMNKKLTAPDKDRNEKEEDNRKKEKNEKKELYNLIKKSKRNQKYSKINVLYNEKFFDKTVFVNMKNNEGKEEANKMIIDNNINDNNNNISTINDNKAITGKENIKYDYSQSINNEILEFNRTFQRMKTTPLYNNSLIDIEKNENSIFNKKGDQTFEENVVNNFSSSLINKIHSIPFDNNSVNNKSSTLTNANKANLNPLTSSIYVDNTSLNKTSGIAGSPFNVSKIGMATSDPADSGKKLDFNISLPHNQMTSYNSKQVSSKISELLDNINNSSLFLSNNQLKNYSQRNSQIIKDITSKENVSNFQNQLIDESSDSIKCYTNKTNYDQIDLCDFVKKKRNRAEGYYNPLMISGTFQSSYITSPEWTTQYRQISNLIYDLNDYNMNFEVLNQTDNQNKDQQGKSETSPNPPNNSTGEDFFSSLINNKIKSVHSPPLKIGNSKGNLVTHAKCSYNFTYNKINLTYDDLGDFHRPNFCKWMTQERSKRNFSIVIGEGCDLSNDTKNKRWTCKIVTKATLLRKEKKLATKNIQYMNAYEIFKDRKKLSLIDGKYCLFEHIDEYPLFVSNFGMANKMKKYLYSNKLFTSSANNPNVKLTESEARTYNMIGPNGIQISMLQNQKIPLLGQIDQNEIKGINIIDNNMYRAPVFYENIKEDNSSNNISKPKKRYNFLLTLKRSKDGKQQFYIREVEHLYTVAQEEPKVEVYPPQSRQYNNFLKNKIETYTYKLYNEIGYKAGINFKVFTNLFPAVTEQVLKKNFKEMNIEIDKNICYFTKIPNEINQSRITPENICQFESCQFGIYKLREVGIKNLTNADKISYATNKFINQTPDEKQQYLAKVIEEELLTTPWNITQNYLQSKQIKGMLAIKGIGDPSNGNGGYSFLKMPVKSYNENKTLKEEMDVLKNQNKNIKTVTGTDADLRKLSKEEIKIKLIQLGIPEERIKKLSRWARVDLLRIESSRAYELGYEGEITKYARNQRFNTKTQREEYQKNINAVFKKQIDYIINNPSLDQSDVSIDEEKEKEMNQYADYSQMNSSEYYFNDDDKNKKSMAFMRNIIFPNKKKKPSGSQNESFAMPEKSVASKRSAAHNKKDDDKIIRVYSKSQGGPFEDQNIKIKLDLNGDYDFLKNKTKGGFDSIYEYDLDNKNSSFKRKRRDTPEKLYNELLGDIIDFCIRNDYSKLFLMPVKKKDYPDYFEIVKQPMDLGSMKNKTKRSEYKTSQDLLNDFDLMIKASELYNGDLHEVTQQARRIKEIAIGQIEENKERIKELENKMIEEMNEKGNNIIIK